MASSSESDVGGGEGAVARSAAPARRKAKGKRNMARGVRRRTGRRLSKEDRLAWERGGRVEARRATRGGAAGDSRRNPREAGCLGGGRGRERIGRATAQETPRGSGIRPRSWGIRRVDTGGNGRLTGGAGQPEKSGEKEGGGRNQSEGKEQAQAEAGVTRDEFVVGLQVVGVPGVGGFAVGVFGGMTGRVPVVVMPVVGEVGVLGEETGALELDVQGGRAPEHDQQDGGESLPGRHRGEKVTPRREKQAASGRGAARDCPRAGGKTHRRVAAGRVAWAASWLAREGQRLQAGGLGKN